MNTQVLTKNGFIIGLIITLLPFIFISVYNFPAGFDDFNNANIAREYGVWGTFDFFYKHWSGRYTLIFITAILNPIKSGDWYIGVKVMPVVILLSYFFSIYFFLGSIYQNLTSTVKILVGSLSLLILYLFAVPSVAEIIYWFTGAYTYAIGMIFFLIAAGAIINYCFAENKIKKATLLLVSSLFAVGAIGANESALMGILVLSFIAVSFNFLTKSKFTYFFLFLFLIVLSASVISIMAPGNFVRNAGVNGQESVFSILKIVKAALHSIYFSAINMVGWINNFVLILFTILYIPEALNLINRFPWLKKVTSLNPLISLFLSLIFISVQAFPSYLGMSDVDLRVWSSIYFFFLLTWFFNITVLVNYWEQYIQRINLSNIFLIKYLIIALLLLSSQGNVNQAYFDLFLRAPNFSSSLKERYKKIENSKGKDLIVSPIFERTYQYPKTLFSTDITTKVQDYRNTSLSKYFNLKTIKLEKDPVR